MSKPKARTSTSAIVTVKVRVHVGSWGPECQLDQVYRQAVEGANGKIRMALRGVAGGFEIVGEPEVSAITTDMERTP